MRIVCTIFRYTRLTGVFVCCLSSCFLALVIPARTRFPGRSNPPPTLVTSQTLVYVVDTPRTSNPTTFMSNMLYACSVLYKSRLPLVLALNKVCVHVLLRSGSGPRCARFLRDANRSFTGVIGSVMGATILSLVFSWAVRERNFRTVQERPCVISVCTPDLASFSALHRPPSKCGALYRPLSSHVILRPASFVCVFVLSSFCVVLRRQSDILSPKFALEWMSDFEKLQEALDTSGDESYMNSLNRSLALVLDEFYNALTAVGVSAASGDGMPALFKVRVF